MKEINEIINRETKAWNEQNVESLLSVFHPDMVWIWPKTPLSHNPIEWKTEMGKFEYNRWKAIYETLFSSYNLIKNERNTVKIEISNEKDGAFAVVDINTIWKDKSTGELMIWKGRTCKTYVKKDDEWKMIAQTGVLDYRNL